MHKLLIAMNDEHAILLILLCDHESDIYWLNFWVAVSLPSNHQTMFSHLTNLVYVLDGPQNYLKWASQMQAYLQSQGQWRTMMKNCPTTYTWSTPWPTRLRRRTQTAKPSKSMPSMMVIITAITLLPVIRGLRMSKTGKRMTPKPWGIFVSNSTPPLPTN